MHRPRRVNIRTDVKSGKTREVHTVARTVIISARNQANATRRVLKRFQGCNCRVVA